MPLKQNTKKTLFLMYFDRFFLKYGIQDNILVGNFAIKPVDDVAFQTIKATRKGNNKERDNFEMDILDEGVLDKALTFPEKL